MNNRESIQHLLTPDNWDQVESYVRAAAHNEHGPDHEITDQFYADALNEIISEQRCALKIMREDHAKITKLEKQIVILTDFLNFAEHRVEYTDAYNAVKTEAKKVRAQLEKNHFT